MTTGVSLLEKNATTRLGTLVKETRMRKGLKQWQIAEAIGNTTARISQIENGQLPSEDIALRIARYLKLDAQEVLGLLNQDKFDERMSRLAVRQPELIPQDLPMIAAGGNGTDTCQVAHRSEGVAMVAVIGTVPTDKPFGIDQAGKHQAIEYISVDSVNITSPANLYALKAAGDSMTNWGIRQSDVIVVDPDAQWSNGDEVVVEIGSLCSLRKIRKVEGGVLLEDTNGQSMIFGDQSKEVILSGVVVNLIKNRKASSI